MADANPGRLKKIGTVYPPNKPWLARADLEESISLALRTCLLNFTKDLTAKKKLALANLDVNGFDAATLDDYKDVEEAVLNAERFDD